MLDFYGIRGRFIGEIVDGVYKVWDQYHPLSYWGGLLVEVADGFADADAAVEYLRIEYPEAFDDDYDDGGND